MRDKKDNKKQLKSKLSKKNSTIVTSSIIASSIAATAIGVGISQSQQNQVDSNLHQNAAPTTTTPKSPQHGGTKVVSFKSSNLIFATIGNNQNVGSYYEVERTQTQNNTTTVVNQYTKDKYTSFYTAFEFLREYQKLKLNTSQTNTSTDLTTLYTNLFSSLPQDRIVRINNEDFRVGDYEFESYQSSSQRIVLNKKQTTTNTVAEKIELEDETLYYPTNISIGNNLKDGGEFKQVKAYSDFLVTLFSDKALDNQRYDRWNDANSQLTPEQKKELQALDSKFIKVDDTTFSKIKGFVSTSLPRGISNVSIAKFSETIDGVAKDFLIVNGIDANDNQIIYTIDNLPIVYTYEQLKAELPSYEEVSARDDFDYVKAIVAKAQTLTTTNVFDNKISKTSLTEQNVKITEDGTIEIKENDDNIIYITQGNEGFIYQTLDRSLTAQPNAEYPYTWDFVDYDTMLKIITNKGQGLANAIPAGSVYTNALFNSFLTKNAYVSGQSSIYYVQDQNAIYVVDNSGGAKKALKISNLPRVLRSDDKVIFDANADQSVRTELHNKELYKVEYVAQALDYDANSNDAYENDSLQDTVKEVIKNNFNKAKNNANTKIGLYNIQNTTDFTISTQTNQTNVFGNNSGYTYYRITDGTETNDYYVINANSIKAINANKIVFKDKQNYEENQRRVSVAYTIVQDLGLTDLNNYLDTTYPQTQGQTPDFAKTTSRMTRVIRSGGDRFVIYNTAQPQINSKTLILFGLPKVLSTDDAFSNYDTTITIDKYVQKVVEDQTQQQGNQASTKQPKDILIEMLNPILNRVQNDQNKAIVAGNEYNFTPSNSSSPGDVKLDFDQNASRRLINLVDIRTTGTNNQPTNKVVEQIEVRPVANENPNGFIPNVRKAAWTKGDLDSLEFFRMYKALADAPAPQDRPNAKAKIVTSVLLNDPFVKQNAPDIKEGTIEYEYDLGIIRIIDKINQQAIVFYNVPKITTITDIYDNLDTGLSNFANNLTDQVIANFAKETSKPSYDQNAFISSLINAKTSGNLRIADYTLAKDNKTYTISERAVNGLDDGSNNSDRKYRTFIYEVVDSTDANNKIKIYDNTNYLDAKRAYQTFANNVSLKHWHDLYKALENANSFATGVKLADLQTIAPKFVEKLTASIASEGLGFVLNPPANLDQAHYEPKVFIVEKLNNKQLVVSGWRANNTDNNSFNYSIVVINGLPNIVDEANATFTLPQTDDIVNANGNYDFALKKRLEILLQTTSGSTTQTYNLPQPYSKDNNGDLVLSPGNLRFEIAKFQAQNAPITSNTYVNTLDDHGTFIKLYKGSPNSYGTLTIFLDNKKVQEIIGSDYSKKQDNIKTLEFYRGFAQNSSLDQTQKVALIQELVTSQNQSDAKFREFNFNVSSTSGVDILYDQNKLVLYENYADKQNSRVAIVYNVQKVISTHDIIDSQTEALYLQVLKNPYYGDIDKLIEDKLKNPQALLKNQKLFNFTYNGSDALTYNKENKIITFANNVINVVHEDNFIVKHNKVFVDPTRFKNLITNITNYTETNNYDEYQTKSSEPDVVAAANLIANDSINVTHIFKIGTKMIFVGTKDSKPTYVLFTGSSEFTTDVSQNINWLNVYQAIGYTSAQVNFTTNNLDDLTKEALKQKLKSGSNSIIVLENKEYDLNAAQITYKRQGDAITIVNINQNQLLDIIVETQIATLDSAALDTKLQLNSKANLDKIKAIIDSIKQATKTQVTGYNNTNIDVVNYNDVAGIDEIKPGDGTIGYDQLYLDETNQVLWFINTAQQKAFALTNIPAVVEMYLDEKVNSNPPQQDESFKNPWFTTTELFKTSSLKAVDLVSSYVLDTSTATNISGVSVVGNPSISNFDDGAVYLVGYGEQRPRRLIVYDKTTYFLEQKNNDPKNGINASIVFNDVQAFKTLYDELTDDMYVDYSSKIANTQLDNKITELQLDKQTVKLQRTIYQTKPVVILQATKNNATIYYLIYNLPKVAQPSKVKIPSVYSFVKYAKDVDSLRFENAIKNELDPSNNKGNVNVDLFGINVPWNDVSVSVDRTTKTIRVTKKDDRNVFDNKTFDYLPEFKSTSIRGVNDEDQYTLIKLIKELNADSELDTSSENEVSNSKRPQRKATDELLNNATIAAKINEAQMQNIFSAANKEKISVEYHLDNRIGDRFILRYFDDSLNNAITHVLLIENVKRIVKLSDITSDITVSEDEFIKSVINDNDAAKIIETKLRAKTTNAGAVNVKLYDLYDFSQSLSVTQRTKDFVVSDSANLFSSITILNDTEYLSTPASAFDNIFAIKKYKQAYDSIKASNTTPLSLSTLNNNELNTIVSDFSTFEPNNSNVVLKTINLSDDSNNPNNVEVLVFKETNKILVANNLPTIYTATKVDANNQTPSENTKVIAFDKIVEAINESKSITNIYNDFFKDTNNYAEQDGYITITQTEPSLSTKLKKDSLSASFNDDGTLELSAKETNKPSYQTIVYVILEAKNEEDNITTINANFFDNQDVYDFIKLIVGTSTTQPQTVPADYIDMSDDMKNSLFITRNNLLPQNFFGTSNSDTIKVKYILDQNKIVITNNNTNKSVVYYNVARVVQAKDAYSIEEIVNADKRVVVYLKEKLNDVSQNNPLTWDKYTVNKGADVNVTNIGSNNDSVVTTPDDSNKIQVVVLDNTIYHIGFEKISAKNEFTSVIAFDNYQKSLTTNDFVDISTTITNNIQFPSELRRAVFNASYGNIDFATAKIKKIPGTATNNQNNADLTAKLIIVGENQTTHQKHVIVVHEFPEVYNPTSDNDVQAPTVRQLASVDGLEPSAYFSAEDVLNNALKKVLTGADGNLVRTDGFKPNTSEIALKRPTQDQEDVNTNYSYTITQKGVTKTLVPRAKVPNVYGYDSGRYNNDAQNNAINVLSFEKKYLELLNDQANNGKVLWTAIKDEPLLLAFINSQATPVVDATVKQMLADTTKNADTYVLFDKDTNRILILDDSDNYLVIFGNVLKVVDRTNALPTPIYTNYDVVFNNNNVQNTILTKLNALTSADAQTNSIVTVNGYNFTKSFNADRNVGVTFSFIDRSQNELYFVDETTYTTHDATNHSYTNLIEFYNKTFVYLRGVQQGIEVATNDNNVQNADLDAIVSSLSFAPNEQPKILLANNKLAVVGIDGATNKPKVYTLLVPEVRTLNQDLTNDEITNAAGDSLEQKVANATKAKLKATSNNGNIDINGTSYNLDDPSISYVAKPDPSDPTKQIVELVKDNKVIATYTMNAALPTVKVLNWSQTNATPLQTWFYLYSIKKNLPIDAAKPNVKSIANTNLAYDIEGNLFNVSYIASILDDQNNGLEAIKNNPGKSIEYNKDKNEIILRAGDATLVFANVTKVVSASHKPLSNTNDSWERLYTPHRAFLNASDEVIASKNPINSVNAYFSGLSVNVVRNTKTLDDKVNAYEISSQATLLDESQTYKDALTYKVSVGDEVVYLVDTTVYEINEISANNDFEQNISEYSRIKDLIKDDRYTNTADLNSSIINNYVNSFDINDSAMIIKQEFNNKTVFIVVGNKSLTRNQKEDSVSVNETVRSVFMIKDLPEIPNVDQIQSRLPNEQDIIDNGGDYAQLIKDRLNDPQIFPQQGDNNTINFGGISLNAPIVESIVNDDGSVKIVDSNGKIVIIPPKQNQTIYKEYELSPYALDPRNDAVDFRFTNIKLAKELYDLIDSTQPQAGQTRTLSDAIKNNPLLKKVLDNYNTTFYKPQQNQEWDLSKATIIYNRANNSIVIKDNADQTTQSPRVLILKNAPRIVYAKDLSRNANDYFIEMSTVDNDLLTFIKNKVQQITANTNVSSYAIGNLVPNQYSTRSSYDMMVDLSVDENPYIDNLNTYVINYKDARKDANVELDKLYVIDFSEFTTPITSEFNNKAALFDQLQSITVNTLVDASTITNEEMQQKIKEALGIDQINDKIKVMVSGDKLIVQQLDDNQNIIKASIIDLPKLVAQNDAKLPSKEDIIASDKSVVDLILDNFNNPALFNKNNDGEINVGNLVFNPDDVDVEVDENGIISIFKKNSDPKQLIGTVLANNPVIPQRVIIDNHNELYKTERNPYEIYELISEIHKLPTNVNSFIRLTDEMKNINFLLAKLNAAYPSDLNWYKSPDTTIMYDINANAIVVDNNNQTNNKVLVIKNVDRVVRANDRTYKLYNANDIILGFNTINANKFKEGQLTNDELILNAIAKALLKVDFEHTINNFSITLKNKNDVSLDDLSFVEDDSLKLPADNPVWRKYIKLQTKDANYIILDDTYYHFSKLNAKAVFADNIAFKSLFDAIIKANQHLLIEDSVKQNTPQLDSWLNDIAQNDAFFNMNNELYLSFASGPNLVIQTKDDKYQYVAIINDIPSVVNEKDIGLKLPTEGDVIASNGSYGDAIKQKLQDPKQFPRSPDGKITLNNQQIDPNDLDVVVNDDGTIEVYTENGERIVISISPSNLPPAFNVVNAKLDDAVIARKLYDLIKQTQALQNNFPHQKALDDKFMLEENKLMNNAWIKQNIIDVYSTANNVANINTDFSKWTVEYDSLNDKLLFRGRNTDETRRAQVLVVNDVIKVIWASSLYSSKEVLDAHTNDVSLVDARNNVITNKLNGLTSIGEYSILNAILDENTYDNSTYNAFDSSFKQTYQQLLSNNKKIVIIDNTNYLKTRIGYELFSDYDAYSDIQKELLLNLNTLVPIYPQPQITDNDPPLNMQLVEDMLNSNSSLQHIKKSGQVFKTENYLMVLGVDNNNQPFVYKVVELPNVVLRSQIPYVSVDDMIKADGDRAKAVEILLNDASRFTQKDGKVTLNGVELELVNLTYEVDENNNVSIYEKDANGNLIKPAKAILIAKSDSADGILDPIIIKDDTSRFFNSYVQEIIAAIYSVDDNKQTNSIRLLKDLANNQIILDLIKGRFEMNDEATIEFKKDEQQFIIRDNNKLQPTVIIVSTKSLLNSKLDQVDLVKYNSNNDYWLIWVSIASILGGFGLILLLSVFIYQLNKKKKIKKQTK